MLHQRLLGLSALVAGLGMSLTLAGCSSQAAEVPYRPLRAALYHMREAKEEIKAEQFSRHRERVERDLRTAIREIEMALGEAKVDVAYEPRRGWDDQNKTFRHLRQALEELELARDEVRREKGDWASRRELKDAIEDARDRLREALEEIKSLLAVERCHSARHSLAIVSFRTPRSAFRVRRNWPNPLSKSTKTRVRAWTRARGAVMSFRRILIAVDSSPLSARAADAGIELARALGGEVAFIHAVDPALGGTPGSGVPADQGLALAEQDCKRLLAEFRQRASLQPVQPLPLEFLPVGKPGTEIVKAAKEWPADVIVLGSHGRGGIPRMVLGSVAEAVMRHAPCPVLVIRAQS
jgi:nucleotide-binding universal stress UspA family protein